MAVIGALRRARIELEPLQLVALIRASHPAPLLCYVREVARGRPAAFLVSRITLEFRGRALLEARRLFREHVTFSNGWPRAILAVHLLCWLQWALQRCHSWLHEVNTKRDRE